MSLAICNYIDFNSTGKRFFLFDTFKGIPLEQFLLRSEAWDALKKIPCTRMLFDSQEELRAVPERAISAGESS
jgi:hypothetical protein